MNSEEVNPLPIREQVLQELEQRRVDHVRSWGFEPGLVGLVNNFHMHLPVFDEDKPGMNNYRRVLRGLQKYQEDILDIPIGIQWPDEFSPLKSSQTPREFYAAIDKVLLDQGFDIDELRVIQKERKTHLLKDRLIEVYIRLREFGYSENDLIA